MTNRLRWLIVILVPLNHAFAARNGVAADCPAVEIEINKTSIETDDYISWAPTFCRARIKPSSGNGSSVSVTLTNDPPTDIPTGGNVVFAAIATPWPVNTTATADTLALTLPGDESWADFVIAGKFNSPSRDDKDAVIEAHHNSATGTLIGKKALMVRVRKDANNLDEGERDRFLIAMRAFRNRTSDSYILFAELHRLAATAGDEAHSQPAFLPWHRAMLLHVERELQEIDPSVTIPYWNWDAAAPNVFTEDFMGAPGSGAFIALPVFATSNPLNGWDTELPFSLGELRRNTDDHTRTPESFVFKPLDHPVNPSMVSRNNYGPFGSGPTFSDDVEVRSHNPAHGWPCGSGHLTGPNRSACDPLFFLLHTQVDRQWAYWQQKKNRFGVVAGGALTFPSPAHYDNQGNWNDPGVTNWQKGSFLEDGMWPWDGTTGGMSFTRSWRPKNQADGSSPTFEPISHPLVPMTPFPVTSVQNLWPASAVPVKPRHMIDYLGKFRPQDGLGFCYDDVPY